MFVELCPYPGVTEELARTFLNETGIDVDFLLEEDVWRETALRFAKYAGRRPKSSGGLPKRMLADFLVGAHALLKADRFLTLDQDRYLKDFPELRLF